MTAIFDPTLYFVTDPDLSGDRPIDEVVAAAVAGGATLVEWRAPRASTRTLIDTARRLVARLRPRGVKLTIDERVDVALAADADGVHLHPFSMPADDARRLLGPDRIVGLTMATDAHFEASRAVLDVVDYVSVGPVFATATLPQAGDGLGFEAITRARRRHDKPIVAIGGIDATTAGRAIAAGADGVAVVSAIAAARDPGAAAAAIRAAIEAARAG